MEMNKQKVYRNIRQRYPRLRAIDAWQFARNAQHVERGKTVVMVTRSGDTFAKIPSEHVDAIGKFPNCGGACNDRERWVNKPEHAGLRWVGWCDEVTRNRWPRIDHIGWYLDDDGISGEVARGAVYQLPGKDRAPRYVAAVPDPWNFSEALAHRRPALVDFEVTDDQAEASRWADGMAERYAAEERRYRRASDLEMCIDTSQSAIADTRAAFHALANEVRASDLPPNICAATLDKLREMRRDVADYVREIREAREQLAYLER